MQEEQKVQITSTYTRGKLMWDSSTGIDEDGAARLSLFENLYENVTTEEQTKVIAPGTDGLNIIRLKNAEMKAVHYTAVLYAIRSTELLPVEVSMTGTDFVDTDVYVLPKNVDKSNVIRAVSGKIGGDEIRDLDIEWRWEFAESEKQDMIDTYLGDKAVENPDNIKVGVYIVVEDENGLVNPELPKTGDTLRFGVYVVLMCISGILLILLLLDRRRKQEA